MTNFLSKNIKKASIALTLVAGLSFGASAQNYPYTVNFEGDSTTAAPAKSYADATPIMFDNINWTLPGVYLGSMGSSDRYNGDHSARMRLTNNSNGDPSYMQMEGDLTNGIGTVTLNAAMYGTSTGGQLGVFYSTDQGSTWLQSGTTINPDTVLTSYSFTINQSGNVRIKIAKIDSANTRINVDDIVMTSYANPSVLSLVSKAPTGSDVALSTNELSLTFGENIAAGTGDVTLTKTGGTPVTFAVGTATISSATATFSGVSLENDAEYTVSVPAGAFTDIGATKSNDATTWTFTTQDTVIPVVTTLNETFTNCDNNGLMGSFTQYSVVGSKTWHCSMYGNGDSAAVYINAGYAADSSYANNDYLISATKLDFSAMANPELTWSQKRRFDGNVTRKVLISTDYMPGQDPSTNGTWQEIASLTTAPASDWETNTVNINAYKSVPFFLAFTYACDTTGAYELTYDDIKVSDNTTGIFNINKGNIDMKVLGLATTSNILMQVSTAQNFNANIDIYDMQGRKVYTTTHQFVAGENRFSLHNMYITSGMYVIRISNGSNYGTVKAIVK